jgi:hypothetical protein
MYWSSMAQDRDKYMVLVKAVVNLWVPINAGKFFSDSTTGGLSSRAQLHSFSAYVETCIFYINKPVLIKMDIFDTVHHFKKLPKRCKCA